MKRIALTFTFLFVLCAVTLGGEAFSTKETKQVAPASPTCPDWSGFYVGGFGAYSFNTVDVDLSLRGEWTASPDEKGCYRARRPARSRQQRRRARRFDWLQLAISPMLGVWV